MYNENGNLRELKIGIIGFGHLAQAIAKSFIRHGFSKQRLLISHKGNPATTQQMEKSGFVSCLADNQRIFNEAKVIFVAIKPHDILALQEAAHASEALIVSCVAGCPLHVLRDIFPTAVYRMMVSGPDTILADCGIAAIFPENEGLKQIAAAIKLKTFRVTEEEGIDVFTAGVCLPAALLKAIDPVKIKDAEWELAKEYPIFTALFKWAQEVLPPFQTNNEKEAYITKMITRGGITEAIVRSLELREPLAAALKKGIARSKEISNEIQQSIWNAAQ